MSGKVTVDMEALPGQIGAVIGTLVLMVWLGWPYALAFCVGAIVGSFRADTK